VLSQVGRQRLQHLAQRTVAHPLLEAALAGLVGGEALGQVLPARAAAQNPQDAVEDRARIPPGAAAPIRPARQHRKQRFDKTHWSLVSASRRAML
jgi:hypothetical protein